MKLHLVSLPHTQLNSNFLSCAYSQKLVKFTKMMSRGYDVIVYANDLTEVEGATECVTLLAENERARFFGDGFDTVLTPLRWDPAEPYWRLANRRAIEEIAKRKQERDLLLLIGGNCQKVIADMHSDMTAVEWGVGYEGIFSPFCAFESYAWMHYVYGRQGIVNGRAFDDVIPNFFDPADFTHWESKKEDYLLYVGRLIGRKGPQIANLIAQQLGRTGPQDASEIADATGRKLVVAGPGATDWGDGYVVYPEGRLEGNVEYVGEVGVKERSELMSKASALIVPTLYIEPFGGVAVEAMMAGTPVIASDWGAFTEYVMGVGGDRFRTLHEGVVAAENVIGRDSAANIRQYALDNFSLDAVYPRFDAYFQRLETLWEAGWYKL